MSANGLWTSRYEHEEGYGDTLWTAGTVNVVDGRVYLDSVVLDQYLRNFAGQVAALEIVFGLKRFENVKLDEKIAPLVKALQKLGVRTLMSCQGHMERVDNKFDYRYPFVDFVSADLIKFQALIPGSWFAEAAPFGDPSVSRLRPFQEARTEDELRVMQESAVGLAQKLAN